MRILFTAVWFFVLAYLVYIDAPSTIIFSATLLSLGAYFLICFLEDFLIEYRKERDENND